MLSTGRPVSEANSRPRFFLGQFADVDRIAFTGDSRIVSQKPLHRHGPAGRLGRAFDQIVGVFGGADDAQPKLRRLNWPTGIAENPEPLA